MGAGDCHASVWNWWLCHPPPHNLERPHMQRILVSSQSSHHTCLQVQAWSWAVTGYCFPGKHCMVDGGKAPQKTVAQVAQRMTGTYILLNHKIWTILCTAWSCYKDRRVLICVVKRVVPDSGNLLIVLSECSLLLSGDTINLLPPGAEFSASGSVFLNSQ